MVAENRIMDEKESFTLGFYFRTLSGVLAEPRRFYSELHPGTGMFQPLMFLIVSSLLFTGGSLMGTGETLSIAGGILFVNAVGMVFIASAVGYMILVMMAGRRVSYERFFTVYALSAGVTLLASWVPFFLWITEPWKWWLIGTGMTRHLGLARKQALIVIGLSIGVMFLFFRSLLPLL